MLKKRIIPVQLLINNRLVKTINFDKYRDVGNPVSSSRIYNDSDADELIFLNICRENRSVEPLLSLIDRVSEVCFMPLSLGGGIQSFEDAAKLIKNGADKVVLNSMAYKDEFLVQRIADAFGSQAVVVSIDVKRGNDGGYIPFSDCGRAQESVGLIEHVASVIERGAGEILINSIDADGVMSGYDNELIKSVVDVVSVPVIACGGAGTFEHLRDAFLFSDVSALACGSLFNFGDNNPIRAKAFLSNYELPFKVI